MDLRIISQERPKQMHITDLKNVRGILIEENRGSTLYCDHQEVLLTSASTQQQNVLSIIKI
jgi:hypothetical protein